MFVALIPVGFCMLLCEVQQIMLDEVEEETKRKDNGKETTDKSTD